MFGGSRSFPSTMSHKFSEVPSANIPRSAFDRSHSFRATIFASYLSPIIVDEVLPGDTFKLKLASFARLSTPLKPIFDNLYVDYFFFFVPYRLVWQHWEKFNGAQDNPGDSTSYLVPQCTSPVGGYLTNSLQDLMGLNVVGQIGGSNTFSHNNLIPRAYNLIWNEWFRDENLLNSVVVDQGDGPDIASNYATLKRGKRHDYFTSSLPWPQKGPAVSIPLGTQARIASGAPSGGAALSIYNPAAGGTHVMNTNAGTGYVQDLGISGSSYPMYADLTNATAATINQLRQAFQIQRLYERDARGGTRYTEILRSHFGVVSPDMRLQRPEYLGGGSSKINVYPIGQTSATASGSTPQGNMAAYGVHTQSGIGFSKSFVEHGCLIGLACVRADLSYQQGMDRMWSRQSRWDFYWPALSHIGEQTVLNQEIYQDGSANDQGVFGYQERYAEYRYKPSRVTGEFRSRYATPLDMWHLSENFASLPTLSGGFIGDNTSSVITRCLAVPTDVQLYLDCWFDFKCARPMPTYGVPGLIDHF